MLEMSEINKDSLPLMEQLENELAMVAANVAKLADAFERIYTIFPDPIMKEEMSGPTSPDVERPDRLSNAIRTVDRINVRASRLALKINVTLDTVIGSPKTLENTRGYPTRGYPEDS